MQSFNGTVVSTKMNKTVAVAVERAFRYPKYGKIVRRTTKLLAHCEKEGIKEGDRVEIVKTKPYSKRKHFKVAEVLA
jgi:small subunit ribosomal protein S17